jgi:enterochelin esterase-like enzyme
LEEGSDAGQNGGVASFPRFLPAVLLACVAGGACAARSSDTKAVTADHGAPAVVASAPRVPPEMRWPWSRGDETFLRRWFVLPPIPLPVSQGPVDFRRLLATDDLPAGGGEGTTCPTAGAVGSAASSRLPWRAESSWTDAVDWTEPFSLGSKDGWAVYACATVHRASAGRAVLSIGSDDPLRVWLNGTLVHEGFQPRRLVPDEDRIDVDMKAGENVVLVKLVHASGPSQFAVRVLERGAVPSREVEIGPTILEGESTADRLVVLTDVAVAPGLARVTLDVVGAGGRVVATQTAPRGVRVAFDPRSWPDGAYEIRCTTRTLAGNAWSAHLPWYKGNAVLAAHRLRDAAEHADRSSPTGWTVRMLGAMILDRLGPLDAVRGNPWWTVQSPLLEFEELELETKRARARVRPYGFVRFAYRDEVDGTVQFCRSYLPAGYDPSKKWPLLVFLHGYNPGDPPYVQWWNADSRHPSFADNSEVIVLEPHGRGNDWYRGFGAQDVLRCIQRAKETFSVDDDRVYLTGESMGGGGVWEIGSSHPELFAALAPTFGGWDYHVYLDEAARAKLTPTERFFRERESSFARAESLLNTPVFIHHGDSDKQVDVEESRYVARMLQRWGYDVRYRELADRGHEDLKIDDEVVHWLLEHRRNGAPSHVRIRSGDLSQASSEWVSVERFETPLSFVAVDAAIAGPNLVRLDTAHVAALTLSPRGPLVDPAKPLEVVWNGAPVRSIPLQAGRATLRAEGYAPAPREKTPASAGPLFDLYRTPFALVVGTISPDPAMVARCAEKAEEFVKFWRSWQNEAPRVFRDTELTDTQAAEYSLLLLGSARDNRVVARLGDALPLRVAADEIAVDGRFFPVRDAVVQMIYPSPFHAARYVSVVAGTSAEGMYFWFPGNDANAGDRFWDFLIRDGRDGGHPTASIGPAVAGPFLDDTRVVSGVFDAGWRYRDEFVVRGDEGLRGHLPLLRAPPSRP